MAKLTRLNEVGIFTRNQNLSKEFYTRKIGLKVRSEIPKMGYLALGATKGGEDASLDLWQPTREGFGEDYDDAAKQVGTVTGIGFRTGNLEKTVQTLSKNGVKIETEGDGFARFWDPDGNVVFVSEPPRQQARRAGLQALDFVTVVTRDAAKADGFFTKALGMKARKVRGGEGEGDFTVYRLGPKGTAVMPFTPNRAMYDNPADYEEDLAHVGENTWIMFTVDDVHAVQEKLLGERVRFKAKAKRQDWGGIAAEICDPDGNSYMIYQMK